MAPPTERTLHRRLDTVGIYLSTACALHCLLLPALLTVLPFLGLSILADHGFEMAIIALSSCLAMLSLCWGTRIHGNFKLFLLVVTAISFFAIGGFHIGTWIDASLVTLGGLCLALAHFLNRRLCNTCTDCKSHS